ncbi:MAG: hypothetical protein CM1200mP1_16400 [Candidatus Neomarinimicrobiota bacterium]|nr:MAG: hypothetical protein CM1200mP1_16400 [Candidatus Neomarinimicrobiota bacterium]
MDAPVDTSFNDLGPFVQNLFRKQNPFGLQTLYLKGESLIKDGKDHDAGYKFLQALRGCQNTLKS